MVVDNVLNQRQLAFQTLVPRRSNEIKLVSAWVNSLLCGYGQAMFDQYFQGWEIRPEFRQEFISLWANWLGPEHLHRLDQVTQSEWQRFNDLLALIVERYEVLIANLELGQLTKVTSAAEISQSYAAAMEKNSSQFVRLIIPELGCVLSEDWDFTYVLWHKDGAAVDALAPLVEKAKLHHFGRDVT